MKIPIPGLKLVSEANAPTATKRGRMAASNRTRRQRETAVNAIANYVLSNHVNLPKLPLIVTIIRVAPRKLDTDNLARACKGVRDSVADYYRVSDAPGGPITWRYWQRAGRPREYACELLIEKRRDDRVIERDKDGAVAWCAPNLNGEQMVAVGVLQSIAVWHPNAEQLRAFIVQCEGALDALMEAENT